MKQRKVLVSHFRLERVKKEMKKEKESLESVSKQ